MNCVVFNDILKIFEQLGIETTDEGSLIESVYRLKGTRRFGKVSMSIGIVHFYWPHYSKISITGLSLPGKKISIACDLANQINEILQCDRFIIIPGTGGVTLRAGFYSGMDGGDDENEDEAEFSDGFDGNSYWNIRMLIFQMIHNYRCFSPLFKKLIKTDKLPSEIIEEFWAEIPKKLKQDLREYDE